MLSSLTAAARTRIVGILLVALCFAIVYDSIRHNLDDDQVAAAQPVSSSFSSGYFAEKHIKVNTLHRHHHFLPRSNSSSSSSGSTQEKRQRQRIADVQSAAEQLRARGSIISEQESEALFSSSTLPPLYLDKKRFYVEGPSATFRLLRRTAVFDRDREPTLIIPNLTLSECWHRCVTMGPHGSEKKGGGGRCTHFSRGVFGEDPIKEPPDQTELELQWQEQHPHRLKQAKLQHIPEGKLEALSCAFAKRQFPRKQKPTLALSSPSLSSQPSSLLGVKSGLASADQKLDSLLVDGDGGVVVGVARSASAAALFSAERQSSSSLLRQRELCLLHAGIPNLTPHAGSEVWLPDRITEDTSIGLSPATVLEKEGGERHELPSLGGERTTARKRKRSPWRNRNVRDRSLPSSLVTVGVQVTGRSALAVQSAFAGLRTWLKDEPNVAVFFDRTAYHVGPLIGVLEQMKREEAAAAHGSNNHHRAAPTAAAAATSHPHFACVTKLELLHLMSHLDDADFDDAATKEFHDKTLSAVEAVEMFFPVQSEETKKKKRLLISPRRRHYHHHQQQEQRSLHHGDGDDVDRPTTSTTDNLTEFLNFQPRFLNGNVIDHDADDDHDDTPVFGGHAAYDDDDETHHHYHPRPFRGSVRNALDNNKNNNYNKGTSSSNSKTSSSFHIAHYHNRKFLHHQKLSGIRASGAAANRLQRLRTLGQHTLSRPAPGAGWQFDAADGWPDPSRDLLRNETISRSFGIALPAVRDSLYSAQWWQEYVDADSPGPQEKAATATSKTTFLSARDVRQRVAAADRDHDSSSSFDSSSSSSRCFTQRIQGPEFSFDLSRPMPNIFSTRASSSSSSSSSYSVPSSGYHFFRLLRAPAHRFLRGGLPGSWKTLRVLDELALFFPTSSWYFVVEEHTFVLIRTLHYLLRLASLSLHHRTSRSYFGFTGSVNALEYVNTRAGMLLPHSALHLARKKFPLCVAICRQPYGEARVSCCMHAADVHEATVRTFWPMRFERAHPLVNFSVSASAAGFHFMADMRFEEYLVERALGRKEAELLAAAAAHKLAKLQRDDDAARDRSTTTGKSGSRKSSGSIDHADRFYSRIDENWKRRAAAAAASLTSSSSSSSSSLLHSRGNEKISLFDEVLTSNDIFYGVAFFNTSFCRTAV